MSKTACNRQKLKYDRPTDRWTDRQRECTRLKKMVVVEAAVVAGPQPHVLWMRRHIIHTLQKHITHVFPFHTHQCTSIWSRGDDDALMLINWDGFTLTRYWRGWVMVDIHMPRNRRSYPRIAYGQQHPLPICLSVTGFRRADCSSASEDWFGILAIWDFRWDFGH